MTTTEGQLAQNVRAATEGERPAIELGALYEDNEGKLRSVVELRPDSDVVKYDDFRSDDYIEESIETFAAAIKRQVPDDEIDAAIDAYIKAADVDGLTTIATNVDGQPANVVLDGTVPKQQRLIAPDMDEIIARLELKRSELASAELEEKDAKEELKECRQRTEKLQEQCNDIVDELIEAKHSQPQLPLTVDADPEQPADDVVAERDDQVTVDDFEPGAEAETDEDEDEEGDE